MKGTVTQITFNNKPLWKAQSRKFKNHWKTYIAYTFEVDLEIFAFQFFAILNSENIHPWTVCSNHITYAFHSESTLYNRMNVKEPLARSRCKFGRFSDCSWTRTHKHLLHKQTLNHLDKLAKWLSSAVSTYPYGTFDCMFLSCHVRVSEWIYILQLPECQGTLFSKQAQNLKVKWLQLGSNLEPLSS